MFNNKIGIFFALFALSSIGHAATTDDGFVRAMGKCITKAAKAENGLKFFLADGSKYVLAQTADGKPDFVEFVDRNGNTAARANALTIPWREQGATGTDAMQNPEYKKMRAALLNLMQQTLKKQCESMINSDPSHPSPPLNYSQHGFDDMEDETQYYDIADAYVEMGFEKSWTDWSDGWKAAPLPKCDSLKADCKSVCSDTQVLLTAGCGALGVAAGFALSPPVGAAAGFYCSGKTFVRGADCRTRCETPHVPCNP